MFDRIRNWLTVGASFALATCVLAAPSWAADKPTTTEEPASVEMFAGMESGDIGVRIIPKDSTKATVLIENKTDKPLRVKLPAAFASVPVLAQPGIGGGGIGGGGGAAQAGGGGFGGGGMGGGGMGGGGGFFDVAPEKVGKIKVAMVCLEHGKPDPSPRMTYEIKPIESYTTKSGVAELCALLGQGKIDQRSAQAAAWHLENGMSWQELANKHIKHLNGTVESYFTPMELMRGNQVAQVAVAIAKERQKTEASPGDALQQ